jgi:hypothetical protein
MKKTGFKLSLLLFAALLLMLQLACKITSEAASSTPQIPVTVDELRFSNVETGHRFHLLDDFIGRTAAQWKTTGYQLIGNYYESRWCNGVGSRSDCQITDANIDNRDQHVITLNTFFYPQNYPEVFGLGLQALSTPQKSGWGTNFYYAEDGKTIVGEGWGVTFRQYLSENGPVDQVVDIGWTYTYTIKGPHETVFEPKADLPLRQDLEEYIKGPEEMRQQALQQLHALAAKVDEALKAHQVQGCDLGPYLGKGIPPTCTLRPLTSEEETQEIDRAVEYFSTQELLIGDDFQQMYTAWMETFPLDQYWP